MLTPDEQEWAIEELDNWYSIQLTREQLDCILKQSPITIANIKIDCDTVARESLLNAIANYLGLGRFPTYAMPADEVEKFFCEFVERAKLAGFSVGDL
ncbi:hypothetical protein HC931_28410 [Candidatus Gracilibacteria bacterium]|nr:hypothetical protein [Candidatus Gracilibacteria bacterium]NJM90291.1 hypothetical protein [Hydrococcus sp. RU_2_2]NJP22509.1 hypothetical protein [Hydrococcus sp. CRU_1_1]